MKEAGGAMVSNATLIVDLESHEAPRHAMLIRLAAMVLAGSIEDGRARVRGADNRGRGLDGRKLVLELLDALLETLGVGQRWVPAAICK